MRWVWAMLGLVLAATVGAEILFLAWTPAAEPTVTGYNLYAGTNTRAYTFVTNVVGRTNAAGSVPVTVGVNWFFAVTATNWAGLESAYSEEVEWPGRPGAPQIFAAPYVRLTPRAERTTNLQTWAPLRLEPTLLPATNAAEFFRVTGVAIEAVKLVK